MLIPLEGQMYLSTSRVEAATHFKDGYFREATQDECIQALRSPTLAQIRNSPLDYQRLALAIAVRTVCVGEVAYATTH